MVVARIDSKHNQAMAPNRLKRLFTVLQPDRYYVGDIIYIATQEGWLYLAILIDLFCRKVLG
jgi:putative transposase